MAFEIPYVGNTSAVVRMRESAAGIPANLVLESVPATGFRRQWMHIAGCVLRGAGPLTPLSGGLDELDLPMRIVKALAPKRQALS